MGALLRQTKRQASLAIALSDISGVWNLEKITNALSELAEASISTATAHILSLAEHQGKITIKDKNNPEYDSGFVVLGLEN